MLTLKYMQNADSQLVKPFNFGNVYFRKTFFSFKNIFQNTFWALVSVPLAPPKTCWEDQSQMKP